MKSVTKQKLQVFLGIVTLLFLCSCHSKSTILEPHLDYTPQKKQFAQLSSDFPPLEAAERQTAWGQELLLGCGFAKDFDLFRAITCFKRALFLMPTEAVERKMQAEFFILESYFLGKKYQEAIDTFEAGSLSQAPSSFPAFRDLLVILYESYLQMEQTDKSEAVLLLMEKGDTETASDLKLFHAFYIGSLPAIHTHAQKRPERESYHCFLSTYHSHAKSVGKAQLLNALLPGAGYLYIGQKKTALTSFLLNSCFLASTYHFFHRGNWGAGVFMASLECGWYFGGINGAGLAAKEYNEHLYNTHAKDLMISHSLFPVLMLQTGF